MTCAPVCHHGHSFWPVHNSQGHSDQQERQSNLTQTKLDNLKALQNNVLANNILEDTENDWEMDTEDVIDGDVGIDLSHAGGEFNVIINLAEDILSPQHCNPQ